MSALKFPSRAIAGVSAVAFALAFAAPGLCGPGDSAFGPARTPAKAARSALRTSQGDPASQAAPPKPFLKTPRGVVSVVLMVGLAAWLVQSRSHNQVVSPGR